MVQHESARDGSGGGGGGVWGGIRDMFEFIQMSMPYKTFVVEKNVLFGPQEFGVNFLASTKLCKTNFQKLFSFKLFDFFCKFSFGQTP